LIRGFDMSGIGKIGPQGFRLLTLTWLLLVCGCLVERGKYDEALRHETACRQDAEHLRVTNETLRQELTSLQERAAVMEKDNDALLEEMATLSAEHEELARKIAQCRKEAEEREQSMEPVTDTYRTLVARLSPEIDQGNIRIDQTDTRLKLNLVDKILFPSGSATLDEKGKRILEKVGYALKETKDRRIMIEGHTDDEPLSVELKKTFRSNWDLSAKRAAAVVHHLQEKTGIDPRLLSATGYSMYSPIAKNDSPENRRLNRRIDIVLVPLTPKEMQRLYATSLETTPPGPKTASDPPAATPSVTPILP